MILTSNVLSQVSITVKRLRIQQDHRTGSVSYCLGDAKSKVVDLSKVAAETSRNETEEAKFVGKQQKNL